jgi:hypothetical protein
MTPMREAARVGFDARLQMLRCSRVDDDAECGASGATE